MINGFPYFVPEVVNNALEGINSNNTGQIVEAAATS